MLFLNLFGLFMKKQRMCVYGVVFPPFQIQKEANAFICLPPLENSVSCDYLRNPRFLTMSR